MDNWNCLICKSYNDILNDYCKICQANKPNWLTREYQIGVELQRNIYYDYGVYGVSNMNPEEELFAKFYNEQKVLVRDMDTVQLRETREELASIAFKAKACLVATDDVIKEKSSKIKNRQFLVSVDTANQSSSDAINAVTQRAKRMSKMDKLRQQLLTAGIDEDTVKEMVNNLERKATDQTIKAVTFNKPAVEKDIVIVKTQKPEPNGEPFDPSSLKFGS